MRRPLLRLLIAIPVCGTLIAVMLAAGWLALGQPTAKGAIWFEITGIGDAQYSGAPDQPFFFLALGNDARSNADMGLGDAIHVIGVNPASREATIINVPRDTQAPSGDKINAYHALNGLPGIVSELNTMMGIDIKYAITTNFGGMVDMVNQIGGIDIVIPQAMNDPDSGAVFQPGPQHIDGHGALAFSRNRKDYPIEGDVARTTNQGFVIMSALATLRAKSPSDAATMILVATLAKHVKTHNVDLMALWRLGRLALTIDPANIKNITIPTGGGSGTNLVVGPGGQELFADFRDDGVVQSR
jgi:LCP family protein required for cell wall assembly